MVVNESRRADTRDALLDAAERLFDRRFETTGRLIIASLAQKARERAPFTGADADLFISNLLDMLAAMLGAPPSEATSHLLR